MGLFSRRRKQEPTDPDLSFMSVSEADDLRSLTVAALADLGIDATATGGELTCADGTTVGLWNLATILGSLEHEKWPEAVRQHVAALVTPEAPSVEDMTAQDALARVRFRLAEESYVRHMPAPPADVHPFAPGISRHLVLDTPESVVTVPAEVLLAKAPVEALREAAGRNTRAILDEPWAVRRVGEGDRSVHVVTGESFYTATLGLYVDELVRRVAPEADPRHGIVFALPMRHQLTFHVPTDAEALAEIIPTMVRFAGHGYDEGAGPVSPDLYHWEDGRVTALTSPGADGRITVTPTGSLSALLPDPACDSRILRDSTECPLSRSRRLPE